MNIRQASPDDAKAIATIHVRAWQTAYHGILPSSFLEGLSVSGREDFWRQQLQSSEAVTLLAEEHGHSLGWAQLGPSRDAETDRSTGELYAIYVAPEHWRQGVGQRLWTEGVVHLRRAAYADVTLWVLRENVGACAFYRANGFIPDVGIEKMLDVAGSKQVEIRL